MDEALESTDADRRTPEREVRDCRRAMAGEGGVLFVGEDIVRGLIPEERLRRSEAPFEACAVAALKPVEVIGVSSGLSESSTAELAELGMGLGSVTTGVLVVNGVRGADPNGVRGSDGTRVCMDETFRFRGGFDRTEGRREENGFAASSFGGVASGV